MIKFVFRWAFRCLLLAVVLAIGVVLLKDTVARSLAEERIRKETGFDARIGKLQFNLFAPVLRLEDVVLYNPAEFGGSIFIDVPDLHVEYNQKQLAIGRLHLKLLRLNVRELHIVQNQEGRTNIVDLFTRAAPDVLGAPREADGSPSFKGIDLLNLSMGKVRYSDLRAPRRNQEVMLGIENDITHNVQTEEDLGAVLFRILLRAGIPFYHDTRPTIRQVQR